MIPLSSIRSLPSLNDVEFVDLNVDACSNPSVPQVLAWMASPDEEDRKEAIAILSEIVDGAFGEDGNILGDEVRRGGGISLLARFLSSPDPAIQQASLAIIGNLCSDAVDAHSAATKCELLPHAKAVFGMVYTSDLDTLCLATGALQNLTAGKAWAELAVSHHVHLRLEHLVVTHRDVDDGRIVRYASGALRNITATGALRSLQANVQVMEAVEQRSREHRIESFRQTRARGIISRAIRRIPPARRRQRQELGLLRKRQHSAVGDTSSECSGTTWSYEIGPYVRSRDVSRDGSRPASACSHGSGSHAGSHASSYRTASSLR